MGMSRDLRSYSRQTTIRLAIGGVLLLFFVGDGLIFFFYGQQAAIMGLVCLLFGLAPLVLIGLALWVIEWIARKTTG
jgi:hypothetical protein